jgi:Immunity protein 49
MAHHPDLRLAAEIAAGLEAVRDRQTAHALDDTLALPILATACFDAAACQHAGGRSDALRASLRLGLDASLAVFGAASGGGTTVRYTIAGRGVERVSSLGPGSAHAGHWTHAFAAATLLGDRAAQDRLAALPLSPSTQVEDYLVRWQAAQRAFLATGRFDFDGMVAAMEATDPDRLPDDLVDFALSIDVPAITLAWRIGDADAAAAQASLIDGLAKHETFWSQPAEMRWPDGFVSWRLSTWKRIARDRGLALDTRSRYLVEL